MDRLQRPEPSQNQTKWKRLGLGPRTNIDHRSCDNGGAGQTRRKELGLRSGLQREMSERGLLPDFSSAREGKDAGSIQTHRIRGAAHIARFEGASRKRDARSREALS